MQIQERLSMWGTFKKIFFGPKGPDTKIQPLLYQDGLLAFRASEQIKFGTHKVLAPSRLGESEVRLDIFSYDENEDMYRAQLADEVFTLDALRLERRGEFRPPKSIRVASSDLPGYEGRTEDLSLGGARLTINGKVTPGDFATITFYFNDGMTPDLNLRCEFRWCAHKKGNKFHCGVRFSSIEKSERVAIKRYIQNQVAMGGI